MLAIDSDLRLTSYAHIDSDPCAISGSAAQVPLCLLDPFGRRSARSSAM